MGSNPAQGNSTCFSFDTINQLIYRMGFISSFYGLYKHPTGVQGDVGSNPAQGNSSCFSFESINQLIYRMGFISSFYGIYIYIYIYIYIP